MGYNDESGNKDINPCSNRDLARAERGVTTLMGDKVEPRRKWIEANVEFGLQEDSGSILDNENISVAEEVEPL